MPISWYIHVFNCNLPWARWRHQMETFSSLLAICEGNPPVTGGFPSRRPVTWSFDVFLMFASTNGWAKNGDAGDLKRHRAQYDVNVMGDLSHCYFVNKRNCIPYWRQIINNIPTYWLLYTVTLKIAVVISSIAYSSYWSVHVLEIVVYNYIQYRLSLHFI